MVANSWAKLTMFDRVKHRMHEKGVAIDPPIRALMRNARPFVVTERAAIRMRVAMASYPEMIAENAAFAIPPFPAMWIEFPNRTLLHHSRLSGVTTNEDLAQMGLLPVPGSVDHSPFSDPTTDLHVGYLIDGNRVGVFVEGDALMPTIMPFGYTLHRPQPLEEQLVTADWFGVSRIGLDPFLWGYSMHATLTPRHQRMLRDQHSLFIKQSMVDDPPSEEARAYLMRGASGELRNILAILLMINQPTKVIQTTQVPRARGVVRGKTATYWGHQLIDINLDARSRVNILAKPKGSSWHMRWHEVRGHFVHRNVRGSNHAHDWQADPERDRRWRCGEEGCKAMRTWREYPEGHGSATVGYVEQVRRVRTGRDQPASRG